MAYPPRLLLPNEIYFITSRTIDGAFFLRPSEEVNNTIGSILADAQEQSDVELFDFVFLSNHLHLAARSAECRLPQFMQYLKANIAVTINRVLGRRGHLWERRYSASPILDEGAQAERATYIYGHGVKEGLVARAELWPGVASVKERLSGTTPTYQRVDQSGLTRHRENRLDEPNLANYRRPVTIKLSEWTFMSGLSAQTSRRQTQQLVDLALEKSHPTRRGKSSLGVRKVLVQDPRSRPHAEPRRKPNPRCHASSPRRRRDYTKSLGLFLADYAESSRRFRAGEFDVSFPLHSHRPTLPLGWTAVTRAGPSGVQLRAR